MTVCMQKWHGPAKIPSNIVILLWNVSVGIRSQILVGVFISQFITVAYCAMRSRNEKQLSKHVKPAMRAQKEKKTQTNNEIKEG